MGAGVVGVEDQHLGEPAGLEGLGDGGRRGVEGVVPELVVAVEAEQALVADLVRAAVDGVREDHAAAVRVGRLVVVDRCTSRARRRCPSTLYFIGVSWTIIRPVLQLYLHLWTNWTPPAGYAIRYTATVQGGVEMTDTLSKAEQNGRFKPGGGATGRVHPPGWYVAPLPTGPRPKNRSVGPVVRSSRGARTFLGFWALG